MQLSSIEDQVNQNTVWVLFCIIFLSSDILSGKLTKFSGQFRNLSFLSDSPMVFAKTGMTGLLYVLGSYVMHYYAFYEEFSVFNISFKFPFSLILSLRLNIFNIMKINDFEMKAS